MSEKDQKRLIKIIEEETYLKPHQFSSSTFNNIGCDERDYDSFCDTVKEEFDVDLREATNIHTKITEILSFF